MTQADKNRPRESPFGQGTLRFLETPEGASFHGTAPQKSKLTGGNKSGKRRMGWAALLKRTFQIDVLHCPKCSGRMKLVEVVMSGDLQGKKSMNWKCTVAMR